MSSLAISALANLSAQLSSPISKDTSPGNASTLLVCSDEDDCDFSSFPSLSLEESPGNYHQGNFTSRGDVETHVESLLARPILLGKQEDDERSSAGLMEGDDSLDEFFVQQLNEVPKLMMSNFCTSFATLMNSRLRAYTSFLARHALSLARSSQTEQEKDGVVGIEHKLETMLAIGSQVSTGSVSSEFSIHQSHIPEVLPIEGDEKDCQVSMPLKVKICVTIALPHVKEADGNESMEVFFETTGKLCGIFAKDGEEPSRLRVAEVTINMHELLNVMAAQAAEVISCIVEMTNAAHRVPLPSRDVASSPALPTVVTAEPKKRKAEEPDDDAIVALSPEKCANIVDCVIGELDDDLLTPRTFKKLKVIHPPLA